MLIPTKFSDDAKGNQVKAFLQWMLTDGQKMAPSESYAALPAKVVAKEQAQLKQLTAPAADKKAPAAGKKSPK